MDPNLPLTTPQEPSASINCFPHKSTAVYQSSNFTNTKLCNTFLLSRSTSPDQLLASFSNGTLKPSSGLPPLHPNTKLKRKKPNQQGGNPNFTKEKTLTLDKTPDPCSECGRQFWTAKALYGHMRCHPERNWRGMKPAKTHAQPLEKGIEKGKSKKRKGVWTWFTKPRTERKCVGFIYNGVLGSSNPNPTCESSSLVDWS